MSQPDKKIKEPICPTIKLPELIQGERLKGAKGSYRVEKKLKDIENCRIYLVFLNDDKENDKKMEAKIQTKGESSGFWRRFKNEIAILEAAKRYEERCPNLVHIQDKGELRDIEFIILPHFSHDVEKLYKFLGKFNPEETYKISYHMAEGLRQLHAMDVFHGYIRLGCYVVSGTEQIKLTDFGHSYTSQTDQDRPKEIDAYIKPHEYSARCAHVSIMGAYKDDLESLGYCIASLLHRRALPWRRARPKLMLKLKKKFMSNPSESLEADKVPPSFHKIFNLVETTRRDEKINFNAVFQILDSCALEMKVPLESKDIYFGMLQRKQPSKEYSGSHSKETSGDETKSKDNLELKGPSQNVIKDPPIPPGKTKH
ncbi:unnamed protein product [Bursaphelenchus xylophilus]|uniref:(pine wood nematode) hypothetical protein n=1 Tax=Bursaphelenchus xylophilus TaxID=6326 RepID=A0A1I7S3T3_BURXY|nr:unnamed protein product [Bursaphelenchus xylophilus]CAG9116505.1 unnamed protein product [Bursaphelenchus xylophilus]